MSDDTKSRDEAAHETMPPELRPYAKPVPSQRLVAPEDEAAFKAYIEVLKTLNGGPDADPFRAPAEQAPAPPARPAPPSVRAYVPATVVPAAEAKAREAAPAKVVIAEATPRGAPQVTHAVERLDTRPFREAWEARQAAEKAAAEEAAAEAPRDATGSDEVTREEITLRKSDDPQQAPELPGSPWATETPATASVRSSALPSSLRPRDVAAEGGAGVAKGRMKAALLVGSLVVVGVAIAVRAATSGPDAQRPEESTAGAAVLATVPSVAEAAPAPSSSAAATPPPSSAAPVPSVTASHERPRGAAPRRPDPLDDPYKDAALPSPARTAEPAPPPAPSTAPTMTTAAPPVPDSSPFMHRKPE